MYRFSCFFGSSLLQRTLHTDVSAPRRANRTPFFKTLSIVGLQTLLVMILIWGIAPASWAAQVTLAWDASTPAPDGYKLYQREEGKSYNYSNPVWQGSKPTCSVSGLIEGIKYYFVVRAYVGSDESSDSNEVSFQLASAATSQPTADAVETFYIEAWTGSNGTISSSGTSSITEGGSKSYTITPNAGYLVADVLVDGTSVGTVTRYTFSKVSANHTIMAIFIANSQSATNYTITASAGANGAISPSGTTTLTSGGNKTYKITPSSGYEVANVLVDGSSKGALASYTFSRISANHTIVAFFEKSIADNDRDGIDDDVDLDDDNDGMPDTWEIQHGLNPQLDDSAGDPDGDGVSNLAEYQSGSDPAHADLNQPPNTPKIEYPNDNSTSVSISPILKASEFCDPNAGDSLSKSEWLIKTADDQHIILQATRKYWNLNYLRVPWLVLDSDATYTCQVRYYDDHDQASEWSPPITFTTRDAKYYWFDSDAANVSGLTEPIDFNANEIPDTEEPEVIRTLQSLDDQTVIGVSVEENSGSIIEAAMMIDPDTEDPSIESRDLSAYDIFTFRVLVDQPGEEILVTGYSSNGLDQQDRWVCQTTDGLWSDCTAENYVETNPTAAMRSVQDGGPEDADGVANGIIIAITGIEKSDSQTDTFEQSADYSDGSDDFFKLRNASCFIGALLWGDGD